MRKIVTMEYMFGLCLFLLGTLCQAQNTKLSYQLEHLNSFTEDLPKKIFTERTLMIVLSDKADWSKEAQLMQTELRKSWIDIVAYYDWLDVNSGIEPLESFADSWKARDIAYIAFFYDTKPYRLVVVPFDGTMSLFEESAEAWQMQNQDLEALLKEIYRLSANSRQTKENFLINETPEIFFEADLIRKRRYGEFAADLKLDRLAVPMITEKLRKSDPTYDSLFTSDSVKLAEIMLDYPFEYKLVETEVEDEQALREMGFHFVLYSIHTTGLHGKKMLDFSTHPAETDYVSVFQENDASRLKTLGVHVPVYKFYVKHLASGDVYVGTDWDAAQSWEQALRNYIALLKKQLVKN